MLHILWYDLESYKPLCVWMLIAWSGNARRTDAWCLALGIEDQTKKPRGLFVKKKKKHVFFLSARKWGFSKTYPKESKTNIYIYVYTYVYAKAHACVTHRTPAHRHKTRTHGRAQAQALSITRTLGNMHKQTTWWTMFLHNNNRFTDIIIIQDDDDDDDGGAMFCCS